MKKLYTPWRSDYAQSVNSKEENTTQDDCVFCQQFAKDQDEEHFILRRFEHHAVMLNLYPYNTGHLLILPFAHVPRLHSLSKQARAELMELTHHCSDIATHVMNAHGVNVGINIGKAAGAGIPSHLHLHVLPRWSGDTNFMPTLAETKTLSFSLEDMYQKIKPAIDSIIV